MDVKTIKRNVARNLSLVFVASGCYQNCWAMGDGTSLF